jgi:hypothetical protein
MSKTERGLQSIIMSIIRSLRSRLGIDYIVNNTGRSEMRPASDTISDIELRYWSIITFDSISLEMISNSVISNAVNDLNNKGLLESRA